MRSFMRIFKKEEDPPEHWTADSPIQYSTNHGGHNHTRQDEMVLSASRVMASSSNTATQAPDRYNEMLRTGDDPRRLVGMIQNAIGEFQAKEAKVDRRSRRVKEKEKKLKEREKTLDYEDHVLLVEQRQLELDRQLFEGEKKVIKQENESMKKVNEYLRDDLKGRERQVKDMRREKERSRQRRWQGEVEESYSGSSRRHYPQSTESNHYTPSGSVPSSNNYNSPPRIGSSRVTSRSGSSTVRPSTPQGSTRVPSRPSTVRPAMSQGSTRHQASCSRTSSASVMPSPFPEQFPMRGFQGSNSPRDNSIAMGQIQTQQGTYVGSPLSPIRSQAASPVESNRSPGTQFYPVPPVTQFYPVPPGVQSYPVDPSVHSDIYSEHPSTFQQHKPPTPYPGPYVDPYPSPNTQHHSE